MDAFVTEVVIVLDKAYEEKLKEACQVLQDHGVSILSADDDNSVIEGTVEASKVEALEKLDCVDYVRKVFTYEANYPPGDPRDVDKM
jgi:threonine dehydratase